MSPIKTLLALAASATLLTAAPSAGAAPKFHPPSCEQIRRAFHLQYDGALDTSSGKAYFSSCWRVQRGSRPARSLVVTIKGQAPQKLCVTMIPAANAIDFLLDARTATSADIADAKQATRSAKRAAAKHPPLRHR